MNLPAEHYQNAAERLARQSPFWLAAFRRQALAQFLRSGFPSPREEEWKYTNVTPIERKRFALATAQGQVEAGWIRAKLLPDCWHLVLIDGQFAPEFAKLPKTGETLVADLKTALIQRPEPIAKGFGRAVEQSHGLIDFNTALFQDGALIHLSAGVRLAQPIQILHVQTQEAASLSRHLIVLEEGAAATVIETYVGTAGGLLAHVGEALLGPNSRLEHCKIQQEADTAFHFGGLYVHQGPNSDFQQTQFALGGLLARSEIHVRLDENSRCTLHGLHWANGRRHLDSHTRIVHAAPNTTSREVYKALAEDFGRSVFQGRIVVQKGAQKTDAAMENKNLLLSETAEVDSKPQLEIYADDVQCSHGVSVGQLDEDALFYLQTRGIALEAARELLIYGFVNAAIEAAPLAPLRAFLHQELNGRFALLNLDSSP
ncbi:Fe-S cluster assembly protein SufD [Methylothermus subterraneus]